MALSLLFYKSDNCKSHNCNEKRSLIGYPPRISFERDFLKLFVTSGQRRIPEIPPFFNCFGGPQTFLTQTGVTRSYVAVVAAVVTEVARKVVDEWTLKFIDS